MKTDRLRDPQLTDSNWYPRLDMGEFLTSQVLIGSLSFALEELERSVESNGISGYDDELVAEREAARVRGDEYADPLHLDVQWDTAAPMPHLFCADGRAFLLFYLKRPPSGPVTQPKSVNTRDDAPVKLGLIEFINSYSMLFGAPNDEGLDKHRLYEKGLDFYTAHEVRNSRWIESEKIGSRPIRHYIFTFQDDTFECLAEGIRTETIHDSFPDALAKLSRRLLE